jgi:hypothetical protein
VLIQDIVSPFTNYIIIHLTEIETNAPSCFIWCNNNDKDKNKVTQIIKIILVVNYRNALISTTRRIFDELDGSIGSAWDRGRKTTLVSHKMSDQKFVISRSSVLGRHVKALAPAAFAVVSTHQSALGPLGGLLPVFLMCNPSEKPVPYSGGINRWWCRIFLIIFICLLMSPLLWHSPYLWCQRQMLTGSTV